jgi:anti-sigma factor RsiW
MHCREVQSLLGDLIEGELPPETAGQVVAHLEHCAECQREHRVMRQVIAALEAFPTVTEPADLTERVMAQIPTWRVLPGFRVWSTDAIVGAVSAGLVLGMLVASSGLWSAIVRTELGSVPARIQPCLGLVALQIQGSWAAVADRLGMPMGSAWWVLMFGVVAGVIAMMAVEERQARLHV